MVQWFNGKGYANTVAFFISAVFAVAFPFIMISIRTLLKK